jgi:hypothetical protein
VTIRKNKLVTIAEYSRFYNIDRKTTYRLIEKGTLTRFESPEGYPLLSINERPVGIKSYVMKSWTSEEDKKKIRQRRIH